MSRNTVTRRRSMVGPGVRACAGIVAALLGAACTGDDARLQEIRALQDVGRFAESAVELRELLEQSPDIAEANYRLGLALVRTGEPSRAVWPLEKASQAAEYEITAGVLLASTHFQTKNYDEAIRAADRVLAIDPQRQAAMRIRANANLAARRPEAALADAETLVELFPDDYGVRALHAAVLGSLGRTADAERAHRLLKKLGAESENASFKARACLAPAIFAQDTLGDLVKAKSLYEDCASQSPTDSVVINHLVEFFDQIDAIERGTRLWRDAVDAAPEQLALRRGLASRLQAVGRRDEAEQVLLDAVESFDSAAAWSLLASFYRASLEPEKALDAIEKVGELSGGNDPQLRFVLVDVLIDLGELERAEEIVDEFEDETYARLLRGRLRLVQGDPQAALEELEQGIQSWPNHAVARYLAGIAARDLGDYERALSEFREAVRASSTETDAALELARIHLERGESQQALTFANLSLRGRPQQREPYAIAARALTALGYPERARKAIDLMEQRGFAVSALRERMLLTRQVDGPLKAIELAESQSIDPSDPEQLEVLQHLVEAEIEMGRADSSVARIERLLEDTPEHPRLLELHGAALLGAGRHEDAGPAFQRALGADSQSSLAHAGLAGLRVEAGDHVGAIELFERAYELNPRAGDYAYASAQLLLETGDAEGSERRLREIVRHHPGQLGARNDLAWSLAQRGEELDLALELALQARRLEASPQVLDTLGWVRFQREEYPEAVNALEAALKRSSEPSPSVRYRLGLALEKNGDAERAREMFEAALATDLRFPEEEEARRRLAQIAGG